MDDENSLKSTQDITPTPTLSTRQEDASLTHRELVEKTFKDMRLQ